MAALPLSRREAEPSAARLLTSLALLWLAGIGLRITIIAVPPILPMIHADLRLSETEIGVLGSLPPLLFAAASVPGSLLIARFGALPTLVAGLLLNALASAARGAALDAGTLYAATVLMGLGVAIMQPALPPLVRQWLPQRIGFATAVYTNGLLLGETLVVALTIPVVLPLTGGSWRLDLALWALPVLATAFLAAGFAPRSGAAASGSTTSGRRWWPDWRDSLLWRLGLLMGCVNSTYFTISTFLPDYLHSRGEAGLVSAALTALNLSQLPASFVMLALAGRLVRRPWVYAATGIASVASVLGMVFMGGLWVVFWAGVLGFATAITLVLILALPPLLSAPDDVHRLSAGMFTISYSCAVAVPIIGGALWDKTGIPALTFLPVGICVLGICLLPFAVDFRREG
jgi:CP family cyanate transporter-like MFS transporter